MLPALLTTVAALSVTAAAPTPQLPEHLAPAAENADSLRVRRVRLTTGIEVEFAERGHSDGQPVLFLHGFPDSRMSFEPVMAALPLEFRAIALSMRGHGDSEKPVCCYRMADLAADAVALLDVLGITRAAIVGHSAGSLVAQRIALDHSARVSHLVLVGSARTAATKPVIEFSQVVTTLKDPIAPGLIHDFQQGTLAQPVPASFFEQLLVESARIPARVWRDVVAEIVAPMNVGDVTRIRAKTLLVWGTKDALFDRHQQDSLLIAIPGSQLRVYENAGHSLNWEEPARLARDVAQFVRESGTTKARTEHRGESHPQSTPSPTGPMPR